MLQGWFVIAVAFGYIGSCFSSPAVATGCGGAALSPRALIYPLSLAIYCTTWTFFGSVGLASRTGFEFLAIYLGPALMLGVAGRCCAAFYLAKSQNIISIADFIGARYGKSQAVAATVALISIIGLVPYIALQLKAVAASLDTILSDDQAFRAPIIGDIRRC